jgi:hypothetical protein
VYFIYNFKKLSMTSCLYYGIQQNQHSNLIWMQANFISRYAFTSTLSGTLRIEYFKDRDGVLLIPITLANHFETFGASLGINLKIDDNILFRTEARQLISNDRVFMDNGKESTKSINRQRLRMVLRIDNFKIF